MQRRRRQALTALGLTGAGLAVGGGDGIARAETAGTNPGGVDCVAKPEMYGGGSPAARPVDRPPARRRRRNLRR